MVLWHPAPLRRRNIHLLLLLHCCSHRCTLAPSEEQGKATNDLGNSSSLPSRCCRDSHHPITYPNSHTPNQSHSPSTCLSGLMQVAFKPAPWGRRRLWGGRTRLQASFAIYTKPEGSTPLCGVIKLGFYLNLQGFPSASAQSICPNCSSDSERLQHFSI